MVNLARVAVAITVVAFGCLAPPSVDAVEIKRPGDKNQQKDSDSVKVDANSGSDTLDPELEKNVLQMVENHLPDLKVLLDRLRDNQPAQYGAAIRNLAKSSRRLQAAKKRGEEAFEIEVEIVKAHSSANLLIAKLRVRDDDQDRKRLREAALQVHQAELARLKHEHAIAKDRLEKLRQQLEASKKRLSDKESRQTDQIEKAFVGYLRKAGRKPKP